MDARETDTTDATDTTEISDTGVNDEPAQEDYTVEIPWRTVHEISTPVSRISMETKQIEGLASAVHAAAAPVIVGGNTVFIAKTSDGYAAGWAEGAYSAEEIPMQNAHWFRVEKNSPAGEGLGITDAILIPLNDVLGADMFLMGFSYTAPSTAVYCFDAAGELQVLPGIAGWCAEKVDLDRDGTAEILTMWDDCGYILTKRGGEVFCVQMQELIRRMEAAWGGSVQLVISEDGIRAFCQRNGTTEAFLGQMRENTGVFLPADT